MLRQVEKAWWDRSRGVIWPCGQCLRAVAALGEMLWLDSVLRWRIRFALEDKLDSCNSIVSVVVDAVVCYWKGEQIKERLNDHQGLVYLVRKALLNHDTKQRSPNTYILLTVDERPKGWSIVDSIYIYTYIYIYIYMSILYMYIPCNQIGLIRCEFTSVGIVAVKC